MEQGSVPEACEKFAESLALVRRGGTLLNLAVCRTKEHRYAAALRLLIEAREMATEEGRSDRVALATEAIDDVRPRVSWLTITPAAGADLPDLTILRDDEAVPRQIWGTLQAVDPGKHTIVATASRRVRFESTIDIEKPGEKQLIEIPPLAEEHATPGPTPRVSATVTTGLDASRPRADASTRPSGSGERALPGGAALPVITSSEYGGRAAIGIGAAVLVAGGVLGVKAIVDSRQSKDMCPVNTCPLDAYTKNQQAHTEAILSDVAIPVGLASVGLGAYLLLFPRTRAPTALPLVTPTVGPTAAGLALRGVW